MHAQQAPGRNGPRWRAPVADGPVRASVTLPGSKSMTNRALVLAALADGPSAITRPLRARDTLLMAGALAALGTGIDTGAAPGTWRVTPGRPANDARVDVGNAGTVLRLVPPVASLAERTWWTRGGFIRDRSGPERRPLSRTSSTPPRSWPPRWSPAAP